MVDRHTDLAGQRFGKLSVLQRDRSARRSKDAYWLCRCDCGAERSVRGSHLITQTRACLPCSKVMHGHTRGGKTSPEYKAWSGMWARCTNTRDRGYANYGGRGIHVDDRWREFEAFLADVGPRPSPKHSIERLNVNGHYEPSNCCWATRLEQNRNRRCSVVITVGDREQLLSGWSDETGLPPWTISRRLSHGWSPEDAVGLPRSAGAGKRPLGDLMRARGVAEGGRGFSRGVQ